MTKTENLPDASDAQDEIARAIDERQTKLRALHAEFIAIEEGPIFKRWYEAREFAKRLRSQDCTRFMKYANWVESDREHPMLEEEPNPAWRSELQFTNAEVRVLRRRSDLEREINAVLFQCAQLRNRAAHLAESARVRHKAWDARNRTRQGSQAASL